MFFKWSRLAVLAALIAAPVPALAQNAACDRLRSDLAALDQAGSRSQQPYAESIRRLRSDLDRTIAYARSIGCQKARIPFFGDSAPAQCGALEAQINRLESNLGATQDQAQRGVAQAEGQRAAIAAAYEAQCRGTPTQARSAAQPGLLERLFGVVPEQDPYQEPEQPVEPGPVDPMAGGSFKTLCVRKCDGYYFPISQSATRARFDADASLCQASCPNAEVELFLQPIGREADAAVATDGTPYTALPNAFHYRKAVDSSCSCRKPGQSWADTLADAERMIGDNSRDTVVTEQKAQELSRAPDPSQAKPAPAKAAAKGGKQAPTKAGLPVPGAAPAVPVPTAGSESSGIGGSGTTKDKTLTENQGEKRTVATPDGKKTVRMVAPTLGPALLENPQ
jgi:hypothetical protein